MKICFHISIWKFVFFLFENCLFNWFVYLLIGWFIWVFRFLNSLYIVNINPLLDVPWATRASFCRLLLHSGNHSLSCTDSGSRTPPLVSVWHVPDLLDFFPEGPCHFVPMVSSLRKVSGLTLRFVHGHLHWARERALMSFSICGYSVLPSNIY